MKNKMQKGIIKSVSDKGFGFIKVEGAAKDLFFHASSLIGVEFNEIKAGDCVTFEDVEATEKGSKAVGVSLE